MTIAMEHFQPSEFREWRGRMSVRLLHVLDAFRDEWGAPCTVSPHPDALGRHLGAGHTSQHNYDQWGEVRACDLFPKGMDSREDFARAYAIAKRVGATGIGIYTDTRPGNMIHLDVRADKPVGSPATWCRRNTGLRSEYRGLIEVMPAGWKP
jgi:hypothetical protein